MVAVLARLDVRLHGRQALSRRNYEYDLKRQIIESCLHGVDLQEQAVRLSELRLWLSLVVDYQIDADKPFAVAIREIPRLPDLSHRLVHGDSLLGSDPRSSPNFPSFRWRVDFAHVFGARAGFDIVIGNPPYLSARRFQDKKEDLAKYYVTPFGSYDIYVPFLELGIRLLNPGGVQCVITSNKFLLADYAAGLRRFLRESARIKMLVDLADCTRVFKALVSAAITLTIPGSMADGDTLKLAILKGDEFTYINDEMFTERALSTLQKDSSDPFDIYVGSSSGKVIDKVQKDSIPLSRLGRVRTGIMGFDYWALERHIEDVKQPFNDRLVRAVTNSQVEPFRFLWGKSIRLYKQRFENPRIDIDCELINASTREFFRSRKVIMRGVARRTTAAWDACGNALLVAVHGFVPQDGVDGHFITALLNSDLFDWLHRIRFYSARIPQGSLRYPVSFWESLPIKLGPRLLIEDISRMSRRMSSRMSRKSSMAPHMDTDALRQHLNRNIMALYEVTLEDLGSTE